MAVAYMSGMQNRARVVSTTRTGPVSQPLGVAHLRREVPQRSLDDRELAADERRVPVRRTTTRAPQRRDARAPRAVLGLTPVAVSVMMSTPAHLPTTSSWHGSRRHQGQGSRSAGRGRTVPAAGRPPWSELARALQRRHLVEPPHSTLASLVARRPWTVLAAALAVTVVFAVGVPLLDFETSQEAIIGEDHRISVQNAAFQRDFGGEAMIAVLTAEPGRRIDDLFAEGNLEALRRLEEGLRANRSVPLGDRPGDGARLRVGAVLRRREHDHRRRRAGRA